ncbi:MAG: hypothetical protein H3C33_01760 [Rhodocyclaceae bacterium]|nr:hypothetical protein [Rhodocyclaceae bacterium]
MSRILLPISLAVLLGGCAMMRDLSDPPNVTQLRMLRSEYLAAAAIAYVIYDPAAPTWQIDVQPLDDDRLRLDLRMRSLITGGDGESRQIFMRSARHLAESAGYAGFDVIRYEEGVDGSRPFARRYASGEIRLARSRAWPSL